MGAPNIYDISRLWVKGHVEKTQIAAQVEVGKVQQQHTQVVAETGERGGTYRDTSSLLFPYAISQ
jgi:hypothetical protein